jgi:DNA replication protein DnaC
MNNDTDGPTCGGDDATGTSPKSSASFDELARQLSSGSQKLQRHTSRIAGKDTTDTSCAISQGMSPGSLPGLSKIGEALSAAALPVERQATPAMPLYDAERARLAEQRNRVLRLAGLPARHVEQHRAGLNDQADWNLALAKVSRILTRDGLCALIGSPGSGKTQIAVEAAIAIVKAASVVRPVRYEVLSDAYATVREAYGPAATRSEISVIRDYTSVGLLILDEIDKAAHTPAEQRLLHRIIDKRYRELRPTLLIGNVDNPEKLAELLDGFAGEGIGPLYDRLRQTGGVVEAFGWSFRAGV